MEAAMPMVYEEFLDTPVNWLSGCKPGEYFQQFDQPRQLVNWMEDYFKQRIPVPDMLMNRIAELGLAAEESLLNMMQKEKATQEIKMAAVTLLREIESCAAMQRYIDWQAVRVAGQEDELADNALESLSSMGAQAVPAMREALKRLPPTARKRCSPCCAIIPEMKRYWKPLLPSSRPPTLISPSSPIAWAGWGMNGRCPC